jgi:hypothetical protein
MLDSDIERTVVVLSREELTVILRLLKAPGMIGYDQSWLNAAPDGSLPADTRRILEVAANALIARGFLATTGDIPSEQYFEVTMPASLIAMVAACAFGEYSVSLTVRTLQKNYQAYLHELQGMGVIHTEPQPAIHQFDAVNGREGIRQVIMASMRIDNQQVPDLPPASISAETFERVVDRTLNGMVSEAKQLLTQSGMTDGITESFSAILEDLQAVSSLRMNSPKSPNDFVMNIMASKSGSLLLIPNEQQSSQLTVQSVGAQAIRDYLI